MIELRPYQSDIITKCREAYRQGNRSTLVQLPTGGGKTILGSVMVNGSSSRGRVCWWLVHRRELLKQASQTFHDLDIPHGLVMAGHLSDPRCNVQIGSIQTIARRLSSLPKPDLIVFDEAHHMASGQYRDIYDAFPDARIVGLTATPWRLDGTGLGHWFEAMVQGPSVAELIAGGSLSQYRLFAPSTPDLNGVGMVAGDYNRHSLASAMDKPSITGDALAHYRRLCDGKRAVAFAASIAHSQHIAAQFQDAGIRAEHVDGSMSHIDRDAAIARFVSGETLILSNAELFGEGFDVPAIEAAILLRPTKSLSLYLQQIGRSLRPAPNKTHAIILDHAGNSINHGLPDQDREWSLEDRERRTRETSSEITVRQCPECYRVYAPQPKCPGCGHVAPVASREIVQIKGELEEVKARDVAIAKQARRMEERDCHTLEDWQCLARERGYAQGWAFHRFNARQRRVA